VVPGGVILSISVGGRDETIFVAASPSNDALRLALNVICGAADDAFSKAGLR
jgi:hypothetical protein